MSAALAQIHDEGHALIQEVTRREPAKVVSLRIGITPRHAYNLREGECEPRWQTFMAMALEYPEIRAAVARWLNLEKTTPHAEKVLEQIRKMVETAPRGGEQ